MRRKKGAVFGLVLGMTLLLVLPVMANILTGAGATADCTGYSLTVSAVDLTPNTTYTIDYTFTLTCNGSSTMVPGSITFTTTNNGSSTDTTATESAKGTWLPSGSLPTNCTVTGSATLTSSGSTFNITINGSGTATLGCGTTIGGKSFSIGPSSMEGDLHISPGDWISGGYNFKFTTNNHAATMYTVVATVTVPVTCPDNSIENIVIPLGAPGQLDGGGVTSFTYSIPAGDTSNHATNDQNSILAWEGAVQAPASLCGGNVVFSTNVTQNPHVGLVDWQFHYRDPNAKGKGNVDCTDASNPRRNDAATCGASWSQTVRDP